MNKLFIACCVIVSAAACNVREIHTPTQATGQTVSVTVKAAVYQQGDPIVGATVYVNDRAQGQTDAAGVRIVQTTTGRETTISVHKDGYVALMPWAAAVVNADGETWTFYLRAAN